MPEGYIEDPNQVNHSLFLGTLHLEESEKKKMVKWLIILLPMNYSGSENRDFVLRNEEAQESWR